MHRRALLAATAALTLALPPAHAQDFPAEPVCLLTPSGGPAGYELTGWTTLAVPKGLAKPVIDTIHADVEAALAEPDMKARFETFGYEAFTATREQFTSFIAAESKKYGEVVATAKVSLD